MQIVVLLIAFGFVMFFERRNASTRGCRWRADATGDRGALRKYKCAACGEEAFTLTKGPPNDCRSKVKTPNL